MKASVRRLAVIALGILSALILMEGVLSLTDSYTYEALSYDPATGLIRYAPNTTYHSEGTCYDFDAPINNLGLYGPDVAPEKKPGTTRIIVVGSSFVEGIQVPLSERFDTLLETELKEAYPGRDFEVVALGFPENGTYLNMLYYKEYMAHLHPDIAIDLMTDFDLGKDAAQTITPPRFTADGHTILELPAVKRSGFIIGLKSVARESKLFEALYRRFLEARATLNAQLHPEAVVTQSDSRQNFAATWETEGKLFRDFKTLAEAGGARFVLASWTTAGHTDRDFVGSQLRPITAAYGIPYIDLSPGLDRKQREVGVSYLLTCGGHWGADGHRWVADTLGTYLEHSGLLTR